MGKFSNDLHLRFTNKGPKNGFCAICREFGVLTRDHVPPKNCGNINDVIIRSIFPDISEGFGSRVVSQGGSHFRTLCGRCNSTLLGTEYDPALSTIVGQVQSCFNYVSKSRLSLPPTMFFDCQINRMIRSVIGHLLAANAVSELTRDDKISKVAPLDAELREYVLNSSFVLPKDIDIYYWLYPYRRRVVIKHAGMAFIGSGQGVIYGHVLKFFPFGFWVVKNDEEKINYRMRLPKINRYLSSDIDLVVKLPIDFSSLQKPDFPEAPTDNSVWLMSDQLVSQSLDRQ